jgi:hypothetical protein
MATFISALVHQLSTDADLQSVSAPHKYRDLEHDARRLLGQLDPTNPQLRPEELDGAGSFSAGSLPISGARDEEHASR